MNTIILNGHLGITFPEGFRTLDENERSKLNYIAEGPGEVLSDPDRHILISLGWKELSGLTSLLVNAKDMAKNMEAQVRRPMQAYGYHLEGTLQADVGGKTAEGFGYTYEAQGIGMYGESHVLKHEKTLYYLHLYVRQEGKEEGQKLFRQILQEASWQ